MFQKSLLRFYITVASKAFIPVSTAFDRVLVHYGFLLQFCKPINKSRVFSETNDKQLALKTKGRIELFFFCNNKNVAGGIGSVVDSGQEVKSRRQRGELIRQIRLQINAMIGE